MDELVQPQPTEAPRVFPRRLLIGLGGVSSLIIVAALLLGIVYTRPVSDSLVHTLGTRLPFPAAVVDTEWISLKQFFTERDALMVYFASLGEAAQAPSESELTSNILDTLVRKVAVEALAARYGVMLDQARVETFYQEMLAGTSEADFSSQLQESFGWTPEEFRLRIVEPVVLATQLSEYVETNEEIQAEPKKQVEDARTRVVAGEDFATVASQTSGNFEAANGGDLGVVSQDELPEEWVTALEAIQVGETTGVLNSPESYYVFKLTDRMVAGEEVKYALSAVVVPKKTLEDVVDAYLAQVRVWRLIGRAES